VSDLLVLWDVDYTLLSAGGLGNRLYEAVFKDLFGRDLTAIAPKAGRTDRAILLDTLALAGVAEPRAHVDDFLTALARQVAQIDGSAAPDVRALPGAAAHVRALPGTEAHVYALPGAAAAIASLAGAGLRQSVLTGNIRPLAAFKLAAAGLGEHLDLDVGGYGDVHEVRAELVPVARRAARAAYGTDFGGRSTVLVGDTPLDVAAALATGARAVGVATGSFPAADLAAAGAHIVLPDLTDTSLVLAAVTGQPLPVGGRERARPGSPVSTAVASHPSRGGGAPRRLGGRSRTDASGRASSRT
jgi:phosphoglycolate phosphatase